MRLFAGGLTGVHDTEQVSLEVSVSVKIELDGTSIAQIIIGLDLGPSPITLTAETVI